MANKCIAISVNSAGARLSKSEPLSTLGRPRDICARFGCAVSASVSWHSRARSPACQVILVAGRGVFMTINDPISDMLTRVENAVMAGRPRSQCPARRSSGTFARRSLRTRIPGKLRRG